MNDKKLDLVQDAPLADTVKPLDKAAIDRIEELSLETAENVGGGLTYHYQQGPN
ncbi:hypothetical protein [Caenimonas koreensis]|uniref:Uncharacterized protein n=1 Tax=Caenimonas koreensis DSM 17982 TaxID=1121255 RepID=A0A844B446_9BURK|nr:hypothetical protein [Caenimonas koreensis]MRD47993.1 hypothetical protein [Caenimonas koreensis DSM 17982]